MKAHWTTYGVALTLTLPVTDRYNKTDSIRTGQRLSSDRRLICRHSLIAHLSCYWVVGMVLLPVATPACSVLGIHTSPDSDIRVFILTLAVLVELES